MPLFTTLVIKEANKTQFKSKDVFIERIWLLVWIYYLCFKETVFCYFFLFFLLSLHSDHKGLMIYNYSFIIIIEILSTYQSQTASKECKQWWRHNFVILLIYNTNLATNDSYTLKKNFEWFWTIFRLWMRPNDDLPFFHAQRDYARFCKISNIW